MENEKINEYNYEEEIISKKEDFPEITIIENALDTVQEYYNQRRIEYMRKYQEDQKFNYKEKIEALKKAEERANALVEEIRKAMNEYKMISSKLSSYDSKKIKSKLELIGDKKILKTYSKELKKIESQKIKAKQQLVKVLSNKNLKLVDTLLKVTNNNVDEQYLLEKNVGPEIGIHQSLGKIIENLNMSNENLANQFITKTEMNEIKGKNVYQKHDYEKQDQVSVMTPGTRIYVSDSELKQEIEFNKFTDEQKIQKIQEYITDSQPLVGEIEIILKSQTDINSQQKNMLKIAKESYKKLSKINLEFDRIKTTIEFLKKNKKNEVLPKTQQLLEKYFSKLLHQQKEQLSKVKDLAEKSKLEEIIKTEERNKRLEQLSAMEKSYKNQEYDARSSEEKVRLENLRKIAEQEYYDELNNTQTIGRTR